MDFLGLRICEKEQILSLEIIYSTKAVLYDQRFRKSIITEYKLSKLIGLILADDSEFPKTNLENCSLVASYDPYQIVNFIFDLYFSSQPKYMSISNDTYCNYKRESFRYWLAVRTEQLRFESNSLRSFLNVNVYSKLYSTFQPANAIVLLQLFRNYIRLPAEVIKKPKLSTRFRLPVLLDSDISEEQSDRWLLIMSWARIVNNQLHPRLCQNQTIEEDLSEGEISLDLKLKTIYNKCYYLKTVSRVNLNPYLDLEQIKLLESIKNLPSLKEFNKKTKMLLNSTLVFAIKITELVTTYLIEAQNNNGESSFTILSGKIGTEIDELNKQFKKFYYRRYCFSRFEFARCFNNILTTIEIIVKHYSKHKFSVTGTLGNKHDSRSRIIHRIQKFVLKLIENISTSFINTMSLFYRFPMNQEYAKRVKKSILIHLTWVAMNVVLKSSDVQLTNLGISQLQFFASPLNLDKLQNILTEELILECVRNIALEIQKCETYVFVTKLSEIQEMIIPASYLHNDFSDFLTVMPLNKRSGQGSLVDIDYHTDERMKKFMIECIVCLFHNVSAMEEMVRQAKEYLKI